ncbi:MAG TPA: ATP-binding protein [Bacteroidales bacterium]|nr:ATP-binding protein [Bacteroidales bacterium]
MIYHKFYFNLVIRIILLSLTIFLLAFSWLSGHDILIPVNLLALVIIQVVLLLRFMNRFNRDIYHFFSAVKNNDSSILYKRMAPDKSFARLYESFDEINQRIQKLKTDAVDRNLFLQHLVEHIDIGLIWLDEEDRAAMVNQAARQLLKVKSLHNIDDFARVDPLLPGILRNLEPGTSRLVNLKIGNELMKTAFRLNIFKSKGKVIRIVTFQNMRNELEENELDSYQKLIRILTHEIMNSTGPILSSIATIKSLITIPENGQTKKAEELNQELLDDIVSGLDIVEERGVGLTDFVKHFRSLTLVPKPVFTPVPLKDLLNNITLLMKAECNRHGVTLETKMTDHSATLMIDRRLIEQVLINLIKNALQAAGEKTKGKIEVIAYRKTDDKTVIEVRDNGTGIGEEELDKIFIPFFTTREGGSGIGLSLSRQIMRVHNGKISVNSKLNAGTSVILEF